MAAQHTRSFGREAVAVYLAAALLVFGTWAASRYLILRKFENIEQNEVSRSIEIMRKALVAKNTEIETTSRDYARWDDMYSYVSTLDPNFEYQNFSEAGLDEMNVDLVWLLDPKEKLISSFENDTDDARLLAIPPATRVGRGDQSPHAHRAHRARPGRHAAAGADQRRARTSSPRTPSCTATAAAPRPARWCSRAASARRKSPASAPTPSSNVHFALLDDRTLVAGENARS